MDSKPDSVLSPYIILTKSPKHEKYEVYFYSELNTPHVHGNLTVAFPL